MAHSVSEDIIEVINFTFYPSFMLTILLEFKFTLFYWTSSSEKSQSKQFKAKVNKFLH